MESVGLCVIWTAAEIWIISNDPVVYVFVTYPAGIDNI